MTELEKIRSMVSGYKTERVSDFVRTTEGRLLIVRVQEELVRQKILANNLVLYPLRVAFCLWAIAEAKNLDVPNFGPEDLRKIKEFCEWEKSGFDPNFQKMSA